MKKFIYIASLVAVVFIAISISTYAQLKTVTSPTKYQTVQYPAKLKAQLPKTPQELKARMPKLQRKV